MKRPNILLITSDQQHYSMLGAVNPKLKTSNLDSLAEDGMLFDRAYCPNPTCTPSRSSILTGMYPSQHGAWSLGTKLPEATPTLSRFLQDNGYETALVGKAHFQPVRSTEEYPSLEAPPTLYDLDFWRNFSDDFYGFGHVELLRNHGAELWVGQHYAAWMEDNGLKNWRDYFFRPTGKMHLKSMGHWKIPEKYHYNAWITERTNALMKEYKDEGKPFFLWASFPDPHYPQMAPSPWDKMYNPSDMELPEFSFSEHEKNPPYFREVFKNRPKFDEYRETGYGVHGLQRHLYIKSQLKRQIAYAYGMMSFMDKYIGKILDNLKALGLEEDTIIIFTTDHGDLFGQHGLRHKCIFHYEDLLRVPMIVKYKNHIPAGVRSESLQSLVDIAPTILSLCGFSPESAMTGRDESKVWTGEKESERDWVITENRHEPHVMHMCSYVEKDWKITVHEGRSYGEMYDLKNDYGEHNNLWDDEEYLPVKAELLYRFLKAQLKKSGKSETVYEKNSIRITADADGEENKMFVFCHGEKGENLWENKEYLGKKAELLRCALSKLMSEEPMWMPRIANA